MTATAPPQSKTTPTFPPIPPDRSPPLATALILGVAVIAVATIVLVAREGSVMVGSGVAGIATRQVAAFRAVQLDGSNDVRVRIGSSPRVVVHGDDNLLDRVNTEVTDGTLIISEQRPFTSITPMTVDITVPALNGVSLRGSGGITVEGLDTAELTATLPGSGTISIVGTAQRVDVALTGSGQLLLEELVAQEVTVSVAGSGLVRVHATERLTATVSGSGLIEYRGNPDSVITDITGSGQIREG